MESVKCDDAGITLWDRNSNVPYTYMCVFADKIDCISQRVLPCILFCIFSLPMRQTKYKETHYNPSRVN